MNEISRDGRGGGRMIGDQLIVVGKDRIDDLIHQTTR